MDESGDFWRSVTTEMAVRHNKCEPAPPTAFQSVLAVAAAVMQRGTPQKKKSLTGKSPVELLREYRLARGRMLLESGQVSVSEAAYKVGFSDPGYFSKCFKEQYKVSAADFLKQVKTRNHSS